MTEKRFTIKEMQTWNKRYRLDKEDTTKVIDATMENAEFWTVHENEAYNLCIELNTLHEENEEFKKQIGNLEHTKDFCADVCADCERLEKESEQLKEENEQLRKELKELEDFRYFVFKNMKNIE